MEQKNPQKQFIISNTEGSKKIIFQQEKRNKRKIINVNDKLLLETITKSKKGKTSGRMKNTPPPFFFPPKDKIQNMLGFHRHDLWRFTK